MTVNYLELVRFESVCNRCDQLIFWAKTINGKMMPMDPEPHPRGTHVLIDPIDGDDTYMAVPKSDGGVEAYDSHFATCPERSQR